jgi:hypothetical protein
MPKGTAPDLIFETPDIDEFADRLTRDSRRLLGEICGLTDPEASDWDQQPSQDAVWALQSRIPRQSNRPICALSPVGGWTSSWRRLVGSSTTPGMRTKAAIEDTVRRLRAAKEQEVARRERENLPSSTPGDTWIRVGFRMHRSSSSSRRLVISLCEVYISK